MVRDGGGGRARGQKKSSVHEALCFPKLVIFPGNNDVQVIMQVHSNMYCIILKPISWWINFHTHEIFTLMKLKLCVLVSLDVACALYYC